MADAADKVLAMVDELEAEIAKEERDEKAAKEQKEAKELKEKEAKELKEKEAKELKDKKAKEKEAKEIKEKEAKERKEKEPKLKKTPKPAARKRKVQEVEMKADAKKTKVEEEEQASSTPIPKVGEQEQGSSAFVFTESMLDGFLSGNDEDFFTSTQSNSDTVIKTKIEERENSDAMEEDEETNGNDTVVEVKNNREKELEIKIEQMAKSIEEKNVEIATMNSKMDDKEKVWMDKEMISQGTINSLEEEKRVLETKLDKFNEAMTKLVEQYRKLRTETKKPNENMEVNDIKKNLIEAEEKLEKLTLEKTFYEAEAKRNSRIVDNLSALLQIERERAEAVAPQGATASGAATATTARAATTTGGGATASTAGGATAALRFPVKKCFRFERGQCKKENCPFLHPTSCCPEFSRSGICRDRECLEMHVGEHKGDCWFWRMGSCRFDESECGRGLHRPEMLESINGGRK